MSDNPPRPNPARHLPKKVERTPGDFGRGHLKVDNLLRGEDRNAYLALLRRPGTTVRAALQWLREKGYKVGRTAVIHHKSKFDADLESVRQSAEMSLACSDLLRQVGSHRMSDAAVVRFETLLTQALFDLKEGKQLKRERWDVLGRALNNAVGNRVKVEYLRLEDEASRRKAQRETPTGRKRIDGNALSDKVRRMLGMPLPDEPFPALPPPSPPPENVQDDPRGGDGRGDSSGAPAERSTTAGEDEAHVRRSGEGEAL